MWRPSAAMASYPAPRVNWRAPWARGWPLSLTDCRATLEYEIHLARADHLAVGRRCLEPAGLDGRRLSMADLHDRRTPAIGAAEWPDARPPPYLRLGHPVRDSLSCFRTDRIAGQPRRALGGRDELAAGIRLVLHYDFVPASFSIASRIKGMVSRRCATNDASSSASRIPSNDRRSRGMRFSKYSAVSSGSFKPR